MAPLGGLFGRKKPARTAGQDHAGASAVSQATDAHESGLALVELALRAKPGSDQGEMVSIAQSLIAAGANLDTSDQFGKTALHWAAHNRHDLLARVLLDAGADVCAVDQYGLAPIELAIKPRRPWGAIYSLLLERGGLEGVSFKPDDKHIEVYMKAAYEGYVEIVKTYLEQGADPNQEHPRERGGFGDDTPVLMTAVYSNSVETVRLLIENGADVSVANRRGDTALGIAQEFKKDSAIIDLLTQ